AGSDGVSVGPDGVRRVGGEDGLAALRHGANSVLVLPGWGSLGRCPTGWLARAHRTCSSTATIPLTGTRGATAPWAEPVSWTARCWSRLGIRRVTGVT